MLDIEVAASVAPGAKNCRVLRSQHGPGVHRCDHHSGARHNQHPSVISISWGGPESSWTQQSLTALDAACQSAAALGITITAAAGDDGSTDGGKGNNVDFPASSPHVLACGGTKLDAQRRPSPRKWYGTSCKQRGRHRRRRQNVFAFPRGKRIPRSQDRAASAGGRGVPDVAGDADPTTGYNDSRGRPDDVIGGTSAVAPLWAGLWR